jgi:shikimate kinase
MADSQWRQQVMRKQTIVIVGFMGSGKTTVALELARRLDCGALDLDALITERHRRTPQEIIECDGEAAFRRIETAALRAALADTGTRVIAAGGGAWTMAENRELITAQGALAVWLDAPFALCWKRIADQRQTRPLARSRRQAQSLYTVRQPLYALATTRIPVNEDESAAQLAAKVFRALWPPDETR